MLYLLGSLSSFMLFFLLSYYNAKCTDRVTFNISVVDVFFSFLVATCSWMAVVMILIGFLVVFFTHEVTYDWNKPFFKMKIKRRHE